MGMAMPVTIDDAIRPSNYKGCWYCPRCNAHYKPNLKWGYRTYDPQDTSGVSDHWVGLHQKGDECPRCNRLPEEGLSVS